MKDKISLISDAVICAVGAIFIIYILLTYALPAALPLLFGWIFSLIVNPLSRKISKWSGANEKFTKGFLCIIFILFGFAVITLAMRRLLLELSSFIDKISSDPDTLENALQKFTESIEGSRLFSRLEGILSRLGKYAAYADKLISEITSSLFSNISSYLSGMAKGAIAGIPLAFLFIVTFILSSYYFCVDGDKISKFISSLIPNPIKDVLVKAKKSLFSSVSAYLKSSLILLFVTFFEVFLGLFILRVKYPFIISLIIAIIDFLPILGAGLILIPWGIYCLTVKNTLLGVGLILIFIVVTVVRKMLEPKIMAKKMGAHPLSIVASVYIGFKLFGGWGLILAPILCSAISPMLSKTSNMSTKPPIRD